VRGLEEAALSPPRIGEGSTLEPEQLRLEQRVWDGRAVDVNEGAVGAGARAVNEPRHETLACAGATLQEDRRLASPRLGTP
jgi:hypothetical protein